MFWAKIRKIIQEEMAGTQKAAGSSPLMETPGLTQQSLYRMSEVCRMFGVSQPTVYEWIKQGKLRRVRIPSMVYFPGTDIDQLLQ